MGSVILFDAARMQAIEDGTVTEGFVDVEGHLILTRHDSSTHDAGLVRGEDGAPGEPGEPGEPGADGADAIGTLTVGMIVDYPYGLTPPAHLCPNDGRALSRSTYSALFGTIGTMYGVGDGSTTFNVPTRISDKDIIAAAYRTAASGTPLLTTSYVDIASMTVSPTVDASDVIIDWDLYLWNSGSGATRYASIQLLCDGVVLESWINLTIPFISATSVESPFSGQWHHTPTAGTHTYKLQGIASIASAVAVGQGKLQIRHAKRTTQSCIVVTDQGLDAPTIIEGGPGLALGMIVAWGGDAGSVIPANCLELDGQSVLAATYSGLAAMYPTWVSGANIVLPDLRGKTLAGYKSGDANFGSLGASVGAATHVHGSSTMVAAIYVGYWKVRAALSAWTATNTGGLTAPGASATAATPAAAVEGNTDAGSSIQPTYTGRWLVVVADSAGEYSPTVQASLVSANAILSARVSELEDGWVPAIPTNVVASGGTPTLDSTTGVVTVAPGTTVVRVDGFIQAGYEYEVHLDLQVQGLHATDNSAYFRMCEAGVANATASYQTAGYWAQYNGTGGIYSAAASTVGAIGAVSGASVYVDYTCTIKLKNSAINGISVAKFMFFSFDSFTQGSARGVKGGGYTPGATTQYDGMAFFFNGALTGLAQGKIRIYKRKVQ